MVYTKTIQRFQNRNILSHLKLKIMLAIPALNELKIETNSTSVKLGIISSEHNFNAKKTKNVA